MSNVKFSELLTASYLSRNDYIVILRSGSATQPELEQDPNNYTVQAKFFTASYATHSISSSHALTASYFKFSDINAGVGVFTTLSSGVVTGTNITSSNITASGYVSASSMRAAISMSSPIGIFTAISASNITASNISASGYVSASAMSSSLFHGTASYSITSLFPALFIEDGYQAVSFSSSPNSNTGKYGPSGYEYFFTKNNSIGKIGKQDTTFGFLTNKEKDGSSAFVNLSNGFMISGSNVSRSMLDIETRKIKKLCSNLNNQYVLFDDGTLIGWGNNTYGQLGQGNTVNSYLNSDNYNGGYSSAPWVMMSETGSLVGKTVIDIDVHAQVNVGSVESVLILTSTASGNNLHVCGLNNYGQLGIGNVLNSLSIRTASINDVTMSKIFAGGTTSHAIDTGSKLWACGQNTYGALGTGDLVNKTSFQAVATDVKTIILGVSNNLLRQSFIIKNDYTVWAAGEGANGRLGLDTTADHSSYTKITTANNHFSASSISVHTQHDGDTNTYTAILQTAYESDGGTVEQAGQIKSWGYNLNGLIGDNTLINKNFPTSPSGGYANDFGGSSQDVVKVAPSWDDGGAYICNYILTSDGNVYSTGTATNKSLRGLNQSDLPLTEKQTYQKLLFTMKSGEKVVDISTGHRDKTLAALYLLTNMGNILTCGTHHANGQPTNCYNYMPRYVYRNGQFVSYISTA